MSTHAEIPIPFVKAILTPDDLRGSRMPDTSLSAISVAFKSATGVPYTIVHSRYPEDHVLVCSAAKDKTDLISVAGVISSTVGVESNAEVNHRTV